MKSSILILSLALALVSCNNGPRLVQSLNVPYEAMTPQGQSIPIAFGGYGSAMAYNSASETFYLLTDRGPNVDGKTGESKVFPFPEYTPCIGEFKVVGNNLTLVRTIPLKLNDSIFFSGLPNTTGDGVTGEIAYNLQGEIIKNNKRGLDSEGLALAPDSTFWVSDEYAPFIMQFDIQGNLLRELKPSNGLPDYFASRRPNRGMEGLTISGDGKKLYGVMQSPLYLPDNSTKNKSLHNRIIEIDIETGVTREFLYILSAQKNVVSEILWVNAHTMYILERDSKFPTNGNGFKKIYAINIESASDISNIIVEPMNTKQLEDAKIIAVKKELLVDILEAIPNYSHDKPEGIALIDKNTLAIVNDDDFASRDNGNGGYMQKLNSQQNIDRSVIYFVKLK